MAYIITAAVFIIAAAQLFQSALFVVTLAVSVYEFRRSMEQLKLPDEIEIVPAGGRHFSPRVS